MTIGRVRPGEIISSALINFMLDKLEELESRLDAPSTGDIRIERFEPPNGTPVGERLSIIGSNFVFPAEENIVEIAGLLVMQFEAPSTSTILTFRVPEAIDIIDENGEDVTIRISNEVHGSTQARYRLLPPLPGGGTAPTITQVLGVRADGSESTILQTGETAIVRGSNFAAEPPANTIRFILGQNIFTNVAIDEEASSTEVIQLTVPVITQIPVNQQRPVVLEVTTSAGTGTQSGVIVRRVA